MRNTTGRHCYTILCFTLLTLFPIIAIALDTITATQSITTGQTIFSSGDTFELGFFTLGNSKKWYVGIWYKNIPDKTVVWVANRDNPLTNSSGVLKIGDHGNLVILDQAANIIWSSNQTKAVNPVAQLLDSGNFVVREENGVDRENYLWQSFDHPTDTLLPKMKLGWDLNTGLNRYLTAWKGTEDPSSGDYSFKLDPHGFPEVFLRKGQVREYRSGPWNGLRFSGVPEMKPINYMFNFSFISNQDEVYFSFALTNKLPISGLIVNTSGVVQRFVWIETSKLWNLFWYAPKDQCDNYRECGAFGICDTNASPVCNCVKGFEPKNPQAWYLRDVSDGCVRKVKLDCMKDGFLPLKDMKLPETSSAFVDKNMSLKECEMACRKNCSCTAYANSDITGGGTGCLIWTGELIDMKAYAEGGQDLYVRLAASELGGRSKISNPVIIAIVVAGTLFLSLSIWLLWRFKPKLKALSSSWWKNNDLQIFDVSKSRKFLTDSSVPDDIVRKGKQGNGPELPLFNFNRVAVATNNFSKENELGQGGFGSVYKGKLSGGQDIAVKRLSRKSGQGLEEFKNEIILIAKLQHRNLVRILGRCIQGEEKMLLYEYMPNKSLDYFLFDTTKQAQLDWRKRFRIIEGIARGLLYLHRDSRLRIIHRDLKASNILLDEEMNPKISDFGMARIFGGNQNEANTNRVVGTYGYMSPEYGLRGIFSEKSDVFSFGVLLLEIVSGKKNTSFHCHEQNLTLLGYAWKLWNECRGLDFMDQTLGDSISPLEVMRCIHVGLLCVQDRAMDRPTMSAIVLMISSETDRPQPKQPTFTFQSSVDSDLQPQCNNISSINENTISMIEGR